MWKYGLIGIALAALVSCGGSNGPKHTESFMCNYPNVAGSGQDWCWQWSMPGVPLGADVSTITSGWSAQCTKGQGQAVTSCTQTNALGYCVWTTTADTYLVTQTIYFYPSAGFNQTDAQAACESRNAQGTTATWYPLTSTDTFNCNYPDVSSSGQDWCWGWSMPGVAAGADVSAITTGWSTQCTQGQGQSVPSCSAVDALGYCVWTTTDSGYTITQTVYFYPAASFGPTEAQTVCSGYNVQGTVATWHPLTSTATFFCNYPNVQSSGQDWCWGWSMPGIPAGVDVSAITTAWSTACSQGLGQPVDSCPLTNALGYCVWTTAAGGFSYSQTIYFYAAASFTQADAQAACDSYNAGATTVTWYPL